MPQEQSIPVRGDDWTGVLHRVASDAVLITLDSGARIVLPAHLVVIQPDGAHYVPLKRVDLPPEERAQPAVIPVMREQLRVGTRVAERQRVRIEVAPHVRTEVVDVPLEQEDVQVDRVPVGRIVDAPAPVRQEADVTIIPVYEEVLIVEKKLRLKEELRITRRRTVQHDRREETLREERVRIVPAPGQ